MKGKGYRSSSVKAIWIVIAHLAAVAAAVCVAMFVMIYQTGIRLDDRGKSYTESEAFEKQVSNRGSDILVSLAAQDDINYLISYFFSSTAPGAPMRGGSGRPWGQRRARR